MIWNSNLEWLANSHEPSFHEWYLLQQTRLTPTQSPKLAEDLAGCRDLASGWIWRNDDFSNKEVLLAQQKLVCIKPTCSLHEMSDMIYMIWWYYIQRFFIQATWRYEGGSKNWSRCEKRHKVLPNANPLELGATFRATKTNPCFVVYNAVPKIHFRRYSELR